MVSVWWCVRRRGRRHREGCPVERAGAFHPQPLEHAVRVEPVTAHWEDAAGIAGLVGRHADDTRLPAVVVVVDDDVSHAAAAACARWQRRRLVREARDPLQQQRLLQLGAAAADDPVDQLADCGKVGECSHDPDGDIDPVHQG